jgi:1-aminocyclopropane-1-carboxylate deaminase/D-cysteine desulfhydrase-like pyridoxal-dependent ACC family enzyme
MHEIAEQLEGSKVQIILGVGSCGTLAGVILGSKIFLPDSRVIGVSISRNLPEIDLRTKEIIQESAQLIDYKIEVNKILVECYDNYFTEYGVITKEGENAILECSNLEGILLDPIYTGKVMAGLIGLVGREIVDKNIPVIFIHTGGMPILFSFEYELGRHLKCVKIKNQ